MPLKGKATALTLATLCVAGCAHSDFPLSRQAQVRWRPIKDEKITRAQEALPPKILPATYFAAAQLLEQQGQIAEAINQYRKAIAVNHTYVEAYHRLGVLLGAMGQFTEAEKMLRRAVQLRPENPILRNNLGFQLVLQQNWRGAEQAFTRAIELEPGFARAHINLAMVMSRLGRFDEALETFRAVLPEADAYYNLGLMYRSRKRYEDAAKAFQDALNANPDFIAAQTRLDQIAEHLEPQAPPEPPKPPTPKPPSVAPAKVARTDAAPARFVRTDTTPARVVRADTAPAMVVRTDAAPAKVVRTGSVPARVVRTDAAAEPTKDRAEPSASNAPSAKPKAKAPAQAETPRTKFKVAPRTTIRAPRTEVRVGRRVRVFGPRARQIAGRVPKHRLAMGAPRTGETPQRVCELEEEPASFTELPVETFSVPEPLSEPSFEPFEEPCEEIVSIDIGDETPTAIDYRLVDAPVVMPPVLEPANLTASGDTPFLVREVEGMGGPAGTTEQYTSSSAAASIYRRTMLQDLEKQLGLVRAEIECWELTLAEQSEERAVPDPAEDPVLVREVWEEPLEDQSEEHRAEGQEGSGDPGTDTPVTPRA